MNLNKKRNYEKLADLLFPHIDKSPDYYEKKYPARNLPSGSMVTRLGPSPTGFVHLGNLYGAFIDERMAYLSGGVFYLRIEDTDEKRYVEGAVEMLLKALSRFGIVFDEGVKLNKELGDYGPYYQSDRKEIYACFVKELLSKGMAYPCFLTEEEINIIREDQEANKKTPGIYGKYAKYADLPFEDVLARIESKTAYVIRLRSQGNSENPENIDVEDAIRGKLIMPENFQHIVIHKGTGMPTYHFAHVVDDWLMRTSHVVRGAEWLSSLPIHIELFKDLGWEPPIYCHTAQLMKIGENGNKRKLSKRLDPELSLHFYSKEGYHPKAVREYLMTLLNSDFEDWRAANQNLNLEKFPFSIGKMKASDVLFDLNKLKDISKDVLARESLEDLYVFFKDWALEFRPEISSWFDDSETMKKILNIGREGEKPRKDLIHGEQILSFISYFFDDYFEIEDSLPENISPEAARLILDAYKEDLSLEDPRDIWFEKIRKLSLDLGYAAKAKDYKNDPNKYKGHVGDVSTVIRLALTGRSQSPDLYEIQQILGRERSLERLVKY